MSNKLGVGFIGSGFVAKFHLQAWRGVRDADVLGVYSPNPEHAAATAALARDLRVGNARPFNSTWCGLFVHNASSSFSSSRVTHAIRRMGLMVMPSLISWNAQNAA